jgi:hypothetical protein
VSIEVRLTETRGEKKEKTRDQMRARKQAKREFGNG